MDYFTLGFLAVHHSIKVYRITSITTATLAILTMVLAGKVLAKANSVIAILSLHNVFHVVISGNIAITFHIFSLSTTMACFCNLPVFC